MSEHTGKPHLDRLLAEFRDCGYYVRPAGSIENYATEVEWLAESGYTQDDVHHWDEEAWGPGTGRYPHVKEPVAELRDRYLAEGACDHVARSLTQFLRARGIAAYNNCGDPHPSDPALRATLPGNLADLGYGDAPVADPLFDTHSVVTVRVRGQDDTEDVFMIDFSAAQYGYEQFPLVQKRVGAEWSRDWPELAKAPAPVRTGDEKIDELIHAFSNEELHREQGELIDVDAAGKMRFEQLVYYNSELEDPELSDSECFNVSVCFAQYLRNHGLDATVCGHSMDQIPADHPWQEPIAHERIELSQSLSSTLDATPEGFGYHDRQIEGHENHHWVEVKSHHGQVFGIDFTASQYGYDACPMVQWKDLLGQWRRERLIVERDPATGLPKGLHIERHSSSGRVDYNAMLVDESGNYAGVDVGVLSLHALGHGRGGSIAGIEIEPGFQRMGVATAMLDQATRDLGPIRHDVILSPDAEAWIAYLDQRELEASANDAPVLGAFTAPAPAIVNDPDELEISHG